MSMLPLKSEVQTLRASAVLTSAYVAQTVLAVDEHNFVGFSFLYTKGDETSFQAKIEVSYDGGTNWFQQTTESTSGGTVTVALAERSFTGSGNYSVIVTPIKVPTSTSAKPGLVRVSVKATAGTPTGTLAIYSVKGWV